MKITEDGQVREVPFRAPLRKLDRLQAGQEVVLMMDDAGYVMEISTPDLMPTPIIDGEGLLRRLRGIVGRLDLWEGRRRGGISVVWSRQRRTSFAR